MHLFLGRHFLFTSSDTFAIGCIVQPQHTAKTRTSGTAMSSVIIIFGVRFCNYIVSRTIGLLSDSYASRCFFCGVSALSCQCLRAPTVEPWPSTRLNRCSSPQRSPVVYARGDCRDDRRGDDCRDDRLTVATCIHYRRSSSRQSLRQSRRRSPH